MNEPDRSLARRLAHESLERGDATGWFDQLYSAAQGDPHAVPWADQHANPNLLAWLQTQPAPTDQPQALVVGCGLGDDAEVLAELGYRVTAFDVSPTAIDWCRRRYSQSSVKYTVADVLNVPAAWSGAFDLVVEIYTLQVLPPELRHQAMEHLAGCVARGGTLFAIAASAIPRMSRVSMPWPLMRTELEQFVTFDLRLVDLVDFLDTSEDPPVRRFRAIYFR